MTVQIVVDETRCKRCGLCAKMCPTGRIVRMDMRRPCIRSESQDACAGCGLCVAVCPRGAISATGVPRVGFPRVFAAVCSAVRRRLRETVSGGVAA